MTARQTHPPTLSTPSPVSISASFTIPKSARNGNRIVDWLLFLHLTAAGRVYAAYGGVYVTVALVWLWLVDGVRPHVWDFVGVAVTLLGMSIIMFAPRGG